MHSYDSKSTCGLNRNRRLHDPSPLGSTQLTELSRALGAEIIRRDFNLVSGFGVGIAEPTIIGAFRAIYEGVKPQPADRVLIRPFPGNAPVARRPEVFHLHRVELISRVGALAVVPGNKADANGCCIPSSGIEEEVQIALDLGKPMILIGLTGHVAERGVGCDRSGA